MFIGLYLLGLTGCLSKSHLQPRVGDFCCHVRDELTGEAVPGVEVKLGDYTLMTDNSGTVGIVDLAPGDYEIKLSRPRYFDKTYNLHYIGKTVPIELKLTSEKLTGKILYSSSYPDTREIYSLDLETRAVTRITENSSSESHPVLLGEKKIIFQSDILSKSTDNYDLFSYDLEKRVMDRTIYRSPKNDLESSCGSFRKTDSLSIGRNEGFLL